MKAMRAKGGTRTLWSNLSGWGNASIGGWFMETGARRYIECDGKNWTAFEVHNGAVKLFGSAPTAKEAEALFA